MSEKKEKKKIFKARHWTCILYPESCDQNFRQKLNEKFLTWLCSPLHSEDVNELDNEKKKAHYHLIIIYKGPTTYNTILEITKEIGATIPQPISSLPNAVKYLIHLNNPEKAQYKKSDITYSADVDLDEYFKLTKTDERLLSFELLDFIKDQCITEFIDLVVWCRQNYKYEWYDYIKDHCYFINNLIKSQRHSTEKGRG